MDLQRWLDNSLKIQSIPGPTFHEGERAAFIRDEFDSLGFMVFEDEDHNVFVRVPGVSNRPLIISAHIDTVFPLDTDLTHRRKGNRIFGPGIGDNAVAVAALIEIAHDFQGAQLPNDIWLVANVGEEGLGNLGGMKRVVGKFGREVLAYLVLEGMALGHIYHRGLPIHRYRVTVNSAGGHAWIHAGRVSAIHAICQIGARLAKLELAHEPKSTLNIGRVSGGTSINTIAPEAAIEIDLRAEDRKTLDSLDKLVKDAIDQARNLEVRIRVDEIGHRPAGGIAANHPLVQAACQALDDAGVKACHLVQGSTDASIPLSENLPAVCIGLTYGSGADSLEEYIEIPPLESGYRALSKTIESCFTLADHT